MLDQRNMTPSEVVYVLYCVAVVLLLAGFCLLTRRWMARLSPVGRTRVAVFIAFAVLTLWLYPIVDRTPVFYVRARLGVLMVPENDAPHHSPALG
jgi:hypothetical protein